VRQRFVRRNGLPVVEVNDQTRSGVLAGFFFFVAVARLTEIGVFGRLVPAQSSISSDRRRANLAAASIAAQRMTASLTVVIEQRTGQRSTRTTSYWSAVGGRPVSNLAFTTASRLPKRIAVVGIWKAS
jgi:hypothetical protein